MNVSVQDVNQDEVTNLCEGNFLSKLVQSEIGNYQGFEIVWTTDCFTKKWGLSIHCRNIGPPSEYGQSGQSGVEYSGVKFSFTNTYMYGGSTTVQCGQFSEFVFTVDWAKHISCIHSEKDLFLIFLSPWITDTIVRDCYLVTLYSCWVALVANFEIHTLINYLHQFRFRRNLKHISLKGLYLLYNINHLLKVVEIWFKKQTV